MKRIARLALFAAIALGTATAAQAQLSKEEMIKFRQSGYTFMSWNVGKIKAELEGANFDAARVAAAANVVAAVANSGLGALFAPGTDTGKGWKETRLKPEFFREPDKVRQIGSNFVQQANRMQQVAAGGDKAAIAAQFEELGKACNACHDNYRREE
ncbi:MAG: cytochrome c [Burkholderiales bacterium]|nr:cytochrome c [Burkholderiales bacterium]